MTLYGLKYTGESTDTVLEIVRKEQCLRILAVFANDKITSSSPTTRQTTPQHPPPPYYGPECVEDLSSVLSSAKGGT